MKKENELLQLTYRGQDLHLPVIEGTMEERAVDISRWRTETGLITLDPGYGNTGNTGSCASAITYLSDNYFRERNLYPNVDFYTEPEMSDYIPIDQRKNRRTQDHG